MAPLPSDNTAVLFVDYTTCQEQHTLMCRYGASSSAADAMTAVQDWLTALGNSHRVMTIDGARDRALGSNVSNDIVWSGASTYGAGGGSHFESAQYYDFVGRSPAGRRVRVALFGAVLNEERTVYRAIPSDDPAFADSIAVLQASNDVFLAIDGGQPVWKNYVNLGDNAYWRNHIR